MKKKKRRKQSNVQKHIQQYKKGKSEFEIIKDKIKNYQNLYGKKRTKAEYELSFYLRTLASLHEEKPIDSKYKSGETKIQLQEYLNDYLVISGKLWDIRADKNGYVNKICLIDPSFRHKIKNIDDYRGNYFNDKKSRKENTEAFNKTLGYIPDRSFASHIWINLDNQIGLDYKTLFLGTEIYVSGKVDKYKGKIYNNKTKTEKYGFVDCTIEHQLVIFPKTNIFGNKDKELFTSRAGLTSFVISNKDLFHVYPTFFSVKEAVATNENGKLKLNKEIYNFYKKNNTTFEELMGKSIELLNKYEKAGLTYQFEKIVDKQKK